MLFSNLRERARVLTILSGLLLLICAPAATAQRRRPQQRPPSTAADASTNSSSTICTLTKAQAPEIRGFRLGMGLDQVAAIFPHIKSYKTNDLGITNVGRAPFKLATDTSKYAGVEAFTFQFLDGRLTSLGVFYNDPTTWKDVDQFASRVSEALNLPKAWKMNLPVISDNETKTAKNSKQAADNPLGSPVSLETPFDDEDKGFRYMQCNDFVIRVAVKEILIYDSSADKVVAKRKEDVEEKRRREFKP